MYTCSFLWCSDIQHSYRSRAAGTHWCLWNMQYVSRGASSAFPDYGNILKLSFSSVEKLPANSCTKLGVSISNSVCCLSHRVYRCLIACRPAEMLQRSRNLLHLERWQNIAIDHGVKTSRCCYVMKNGNFWVSQLYVSREEWWHEGNIHNTFVHCKPEQTQSCIPLNSAVTLTLKYSRADAEGNIRMFLIIIHLSFFPLELPVIASLVYVNEWKS